MSAPEQFVVEEGVSLAPLTTLRIGGRARFFCRVRTEEDLLRALGFARERNLAIFALGGGSNLVVPDEGFDGLVLHLLLGDAIREVEQRGGRLFQVDAGVCWDTLVHHVCGLGLSGMECLAGIPGLTGGSPIQNIGAYGQEVSATIAAVRALDRQTMQFVELSRGACQFGYRTSIFNSAARGRYLVTRVDFLLDPAARPDLSYADLAFLRASDPSPLAVYHAVRAIRARKGMVILPDVPDPDTRSAGSFFKNPVVPEDVVHGIAAALGIGAGEVPHWPAGVGRSKLAAAWLIERAGFPKGFTLGPVGISTRHTLALTNRTGEARCADLIALRDTVADGVARCFGVRLEQEPIPMG